SKIFLPITLSDTEFYRGKKKYSLLFRLPPKDGSIIMRKGLMFVRLSHKLVESKDTSKSLAPQGMPSRNFGTVSVRFFRFFPFEKYLKDFEDSRIEQQDQYKYTKFHVNYYSGSSRLNKSDEVLEEAEESSSYTYKKFY